MIFREGFDEVQLLLDEFPAVGLMGARQVGKTTLAEQVGAERDGKYTYLDLESPADVFKLSEPEQFFEANRGVLIILDEVQRTPNLFPILRGVIDRRRKEGNKYGQFLLLGSASPDLLRQSSESLAGRIAYKYLGGLTATEIAESESGTSEQLWLRGGFPDSFLSKNDAASLRWRNNFITTYLEKDIPQIGPKIPAMALRRLWTMLAHRQGSVINYAQLASSLAVSAPTVKRYVELMEDLFLIRTLQPWSGNVSKRLTKAPKCYVRDSGITHALLNIEDTNSLLGHPVAGGSWEGFVLENILGSLPKNISANFYRTNVGAEIDLVLTNPKNEVLAIEIKRSLTPKPEKGFFIGSEDIGATKRFVVYPGNDRFPIGADVEVMPLIEMMREVSAM